jgi:hypothetical protein
VLDVSFAGASESLMVRLVAKGEMGSLAEARARYHTGSLQQAGAPGGIVIKVLRTKWDARRLQLQPGDLVSVGLKSYKVLRD